jgi:hypothetical protein
VTRSSPHFVGLIKSVESVLEDHPDRVRKLGLIDVKRGKLRDRWGEAGLLDVEIADDIAVDYEEYDEVANRCM